MSRPEAASSFRHRVPVVAALVALLLIPSVASADRLYFLLSYTPYLDPAGESEVELWGTSRRGKQDPAEGPTTESRLEWEYSISSRLTGSAYLNFSRPPGGPLKFDSPSLGFIYQPVQVGRVFGDPALYLEVTESGDELELEPKILLGRRTNRWIGALNLGGEFLFRHNDEELLASGKVLRNEFTGEVSAGIAYGVGRRVAAGIEARGLSEHPNFGRQAASLLSVGPALNVQLGKAQLAVAWLPQVRGTPRTSGSRNLEDFERSQVRAVIGLEL
jgi:hypothetical protein